MESHSTQPKTLSILANIYLTQNLFFLLINEFFLIKIIKIQFNNDMKEPEVSSMTNEAR